MPVRSLRLLTFPPDPAQGGERGGMLLRERPSTPPDAPRGGAEGSGEGQGGATGRGGRGGDGKQDNPFAPPPEGAPDRPWQPRHPGGASGSDGGHGGGRGSGHGGGSWGSQWSDRQPGRSPGGFGERPGAGPQGPGGQGGRGGPGGMRWDPTDPVQRRARYALLSGMWAIFFVLFSWPYVSLLLGALALYWGVSSLRAEPRAADPGKPAPGPGRPQTTAAVGGLVTASLALVLVASTFTVQFVYRDYFTCVDDALTHEAKQSCQTLLPEQLRGVLGTANQ
ncbi:hypothetical protein Shyhy01_57150 [Streptomyces hygroscopicus subsp. hygroscopicus]|uniref:hypothetical protein n=1 Tax=Streptomyces sp. KHY 26 TaxID=3097359 RepID=UPI0024A355E9|nr:hypothetical protein [Streptomyces hygroscopicus]GLX52765.1 hypothetical protein Shyhy01_57150 [Streptomyces hygroscopicus subsp. hygroscopicus]